MINSYDLKKNTEIWVKKNRQIDFILQKIIQGELIRDILNKYPGLPCMATWTTWLKDNDKTNAAYADALKKRIQYFKDRAISEAQTATTENLGPKKLIVDTIMWVVNADKDVNKISDRIRGNKDILKIKE